MSTYSDTINTNDNQKIRIENANAKQVKKHESFEKLFYTLLSCDKILYMHLQLDIKKDKQHNIWY